MKIISFILKYSRKQVLLALLASAINGLCNAGLIALIHRALSDETTSRTTLAWAFVALCITVPITRFTSDVLLNRLAQNVTFDLRMHLCRQILHARLRDMEELGRHRILASLTDDVSTISAALVQIPVFCLQLTIVVGCLVYLAWLSITLFAIVLAYLSFMVLTSRILDKKSAQLLKLAREEQDMLYKHFRGVTEGIKELKLNGERRQDYLSGSLETAAQSYRHYSSTANTNHSITISWLTFLSFALLGLLLLGLPNIMALSTQVLNGYILTILYILINISVLFNMPPSLRRAGIALSKIESLGLSLGLHKGEGEQTTAALAPPALKSLELVGVTHTYYLEKDNRSFTLGPINLRIEAGELIFVVGGNGSGKTTFAKLLTGLYIPEAGEIRLNGEPVTEQNREAYRQYFSMVFSDFFLFDKLPGRGSPELDRKADEYLTKLDLNHKVKIKDWELSTTDLSQGQRKRLALLMAYLEDRPVYIFDEWAADQDPLFKEVFYLNLLPELKARGKTVLVISHDDHYYHVADRIIKLDYGQLETDRLITAMRPEPNVAY
ncbi:MAG TPA: cyclic peptide export ABC transporter [Pyrinomonadaceae bacterium]|nr:cyclic peptide export ABC transporter [Pyrinomonadaceae bacterium]